MCMKHRWEDGNPRKMTLELLSDPDPEDKDVPPEIAGSDPSL